MTDHDESHPHDDPGDGHRVDFFVNRPVEGGTTYTKDDPDEWSESAGAGH